MILSDANIKAANNAVFEIVLTPTLKLAQSRKGFWVYDVERGMCLSMDAGTEREAFVSALTYYQNRVTEMQRNNNVLRTKVDTCIEILTKSGL